MVELSLFLLGAAATVALVLGFSFVCMAAIAYAWIFVTGDAFPPMFVLSLSPVLGMSMLVLGAWLWEHRPPTK